MCLLFSKLWTVVGKLYSLCSVYRKGDHCLLIRRPGPSGAPEFIMGHKTPKQINVRMNICVRRVKYLDFVEFHVISLFCIFSFSTNFQTSFLSPS